MTIGVTNPAPQPSVLQSTDELFSQIGTFLFELNAIMTWIHIVVGAAGALLIWRTSKINPDKIPPSILCPNLARDVIDATKSGASAFLTSFALGYVLFLIGVAFNGVDAVPSLMVQLLTYMPTVVLALIQLRATYVGVALVRKHTGL